MDYGATERVRKFVVKHFFDPARLRGESSITIHAGSLSKLLQEKNLLPPNRYPVICGAMTNSRFAERNGARLVKREGPESGQSSAATFTFVLEPNGSGGGQASEDSLADDDLFDSLYGLLADSYAASGGAEAFHKAEREAWDR